MLEDIVDLGPCCACGASGPHGNLVMQDFRGPEGFNGWGCVVCGLEARGAVAIMCNACVEAGATERRPRHVCGGRFIADGVRVLVEDLEPLVRHEHDPKAHAADELAAFESEGGRPS